MIIVVFEYLENYMLMLKYGRSSYFYLSLLNILKYDFSGKIEKI